MSTRYNPKKIAEKPKVNQPLGKIPLNNRPHTSDNGKILDNTEKYKYLSTVYRRLSWLKESVSGIYVLPISLTSKHFDNTNSIVYNNEMFYAVLKPYYYLRINGKILTIDDNNVVTISLDKEIYTFKVGFTTNKKFVIQTPEMFEQEKIFIESSEKFPTVDTFKNQSVTDIEIIAAKIYLGDVVSDKVYLDSMVEQISKDSKTSYEFMIYVSKILTAAKYGNTFKYKLSEQFYSPLKVHKLNFIDYFEGTDRTLVNSQDIIEYIEDQALQILMEVSNYDTKLATRKPTRPTLRREKHPHINKLDVRTQCKNLHNIKDIQEDYLTFYSNEGKFYCFDIFKLYVEFSNGNFTDEQTGITFPQKFVQKVKNLYKIKIQNNPLILYQKSIHEAKTEGLEYTDKREFYKQKNYGPDFFEILNKVRSDLSKLKITEDKCFKCKNNLGKNKYNSINNKGKIVNLCSKECFDTYNH